MNQYNLDLQNLKLSFNLNPNNSSCFERLKEIGKVN